MLHRRAQFGFTLIELLVAISLAVLMIGLINLIFNEVSNAVSRGIATSRIINNSRAVGEQLSRDGKGMAGPTAGGVLMILNYEIPLDVPMKDARYGGEIGSARSEHPVAPLRSDQILFFYDNQTSDPLSGIAPGSSLLNSFAPNDAAQNARFTRIWYGHVLRTDRGSDGLGAQPLGSGPNTWADQWILGRHAMFLIDGGSAGLIHAEHIVHTATVTGYGALSGLNRLNWGLTDVADFSFDNTVSPSSNGYLIGETTGTGIIDGWLDADDPDPDNYKARAYALAFGDNRMRTNPLPEGDTFTARQIAQMHPYFMGNVSEVVVQFAADTDGDGAIDVNGSNDIRWYDMDTLPNYDVSVSSPYNGLQDPHDPAPTIAYADDAFLWRHHEQLVWPYLIRIRYRLHDRNGELTSPNEFRLSDGYDNDNSDNDANVLTGADDSPTTEAIEVGKWFEVIIPVNRS